MIRPVDPGVARLDETRGRALKALQQYEVLVIDGHFDYGNGYHGSVYLNPHQLLQEPSLIWRLGQDLIDLMPGELIDQTDVVAGPVTGGALLAHTLAGLLDGRRNLTRTPCQFAPFTIEQDKGLMLRPTYTRMISGKRVILADDVRNTGKTFECCATLVQAAGGTVIGTVEIHDRLVSMVDLGVPNVTLAEYKAPPNHQAAECPLCMAGIPLTTF